MKIKPWWERRHALLVAEAARRHGLSTSPGISGILECRAPQHGHGGSDVIITARFSMQTGALINAYGRDVKGGGITFKAGRGKTARQMTDVLVAWLAEGRPAEPEKPVTLPSETWHFDVPSIAPDAPLASVTDIASKRRS